MDKHYYFIEKETGEDFLVGETTLLKAWKIAEEVKAQIEKEYKIYGFLLYKGIMTEEEAEASGLDEYC